jgi:O-antigen/teichoic acid export membrane protein
MGLTLMVTPLIVRGLGPELYGLYALLTAIATNFVALNFSMGSALARHASACRVLNEDGHVSEFTSTALGLTLGIALLSAGLLAFASHWILEFLRIAPGMQREANGALYVLSAGLVMTMMAQTLAGLLQALHRFEIYGYVITGAGLLTLLGNAGIVWAGGQVLPLVIWNAAVAGLSFGANAVAISRVLPRMRISLVIHRPLASRLLRFGGVVASYQIFGSLLVLFERSLLSRTLGPAAVTYYVVAITIAICLHSFIKSLSLFLFPLASEADARGDYRRLQFLYVRSCRYVAAIVVFMVVTLVMGGGSFLRLWIGPEIASNSGRLVQIHAVTFGLTAILVVPWQLADGAGFPGVNSRVALVWLLVAAPLGVLLVPWLGVEGPAIARLAAMASAPFYMMVVEKRVFEHTFEVVWRKLALCLLGPGVLLALLQTWLFGLATGLTLWFLSAGISAAAYSGAVWISGYFEASEREWMRKSLLRAMVPIRARVRGEY